jgi:hypothetical protein
MLYSRFPGAVTQERRHALPSSFLSHRLFDDYEAIVTAACNAWNRLVAEGVDDKGSNGKDTY